MTEPAGETVDCRRQDGRRMRNATSGKVYPVEDIGHYGFLRPVKITIFRPEKVYILFHKVCRARVDK